MINLQVNFVLDLIDSLRGSGLYSSGMRLAEALHRKGIDISVNNPREADIIHFHTSFIPSFQKARQLAKIPRSKRPAVVIHTHTTLEDMVGSFLINVKAQPFWKWYLTRFYSCADKLVAVSPYNKALLLSYGLSAEKIRVISNGVDFSHIQMNLVERHRLRTALSLSDEDFLVFAVGGVIHRKGVDTFVEVAKKMPHISFIWVGKLYNVGALAFPLVIRRAFASARKLPNIRFLGYLPRASYGYNGGDAFFLPTRNENQGIVVLEAIAYNKPLILRDIPVFRWLSHEKTCMKGQDVDDFCEAIEKLRKDSSLRERLKEGAQKELQRHSIERSAQQLIKLYEELLAEK
ncbi:MAG: glycosyltransferase family 4 protein [Promethearchaeota archaeon]